MGPQAAGYIAPPFVFRVGGAMRALGPAIGAGALALAALTRQRYAARSTISYHAHGTIDKLFLPTIPILAILGGALDDPRQRPAARRGVGRHRDRLPPVGFRRRGSRRRVVIRTSQSTEPVLRETPR
jgi:hypothetical protein